jgi:branched-chain amino acid transport system ATP-binding protein
MTEEGAMAQRQYANSPGESPPLFALKGVTAGYGELAAIRDIDLDIHRGEIVALFGPNGAGKTTMLLAAVGVLPRMRGTVQWHGTTTRQPLHRLARRGLGFVPAERSVTSTLTVRDNLRLGRGGVDGALEYFPELEPLLSRKGGLLSGGEQQMLALGRALAAQPQVLLIDELSLGLAPKIVDRLLAVLRSAADETGLAVLLVEQQARRALSVLDRWLLLNHGRLVAEGVSADGEASLVAAYRAALGELPTTSALS